MITKPTITLSGKYQGKDVRRVPSADLRRVLRREVPEIQLAIRAELERRGQPAEGPLVPTLPARR